MSQAYRAADIGRIDRAKPLKFRFNGRQMTGYAGDTLASALVANGVRLVARSFKYHRPRGLMAAGAEEPNALVQLGTGAAAEVNLRATEIELFDGLVAQSVNCWPGPAFDIGGINNLFSRFLSAGFYYKTFMWPNWHLFEGIIRRAAGLGKIPLSAPTDEYETMNAHCDVLVVGSGAAGLAAADAASQGGARVMLVEQDTELGGQLLWDPARIAMQPGVQWVAATRAALLKRPNVTLLTRTTAIGYFDHNFLALVERGRRGAAIKERLWQVRAQRVIFATGAIERPLVFPGNDRPGVMLATAVSHYARRYGALPGRKAVIFTNNSAAYDAALALREGGCQVVAIIDTRKRAEIAASALDHLVIPEATVIATRGYRGLKSLRVRDGSGRVRTISCDLLAMSGGFNPTVHLFSQSGGSLDFDSAIGAHRPTRPAQHSLSVGACAGEFSLERALIDGHQAGIAASADAGFVVSAAAPSAEGGRTFAIEPCWTVQGKGKAFVDFQNDVTVDDIALSARENFRSIEHLKRYTTLGMAPDQGKTSNVNGLAIMAELTGREIAQVGTTRYRFPYTPTSFGVLGGMARGEIFRPIRYMPAHDAHVASGAVFEDYGGWTRPACYLRPGEDKHQAELREALAVRTAAGLFEGSPLGKIEVSGPDAAIFLDRIYANTMSTLKLGKARYGLMLNEVGVIIDDGVVLRLAADRFQVGTSSGGADRIALWLEEWLQCEWVDLQVLVAPVTSAWGVLTLTGPRARDILVKAGTDIDLAPDRFGHMSFRDGLVAGIPARVSRVSFTGEISYEIAIPSQSTQTLWETLMAAGAAEGLCPVGVDAWMLLRTEKGYLHIGADTDGSTIPDDVGWGHVLNRKSDFVGRRSLTRPVALDARRLQLVGMRPLDGSTLPIGVHLGTPGSRKSEGYVTSSAYSAALQRGVAIGMVRAGRSRIGERLSAISGGVETEIELVLPCAYDPEGQRLHV